MSRKSDPSLKKGWLLLKQLQDVQVWSSWRYDHGYHPHGWKSWQESDLHQEHMYSRTITKFSPLQCLDLYRWDQAHGPMADQFIHSCPPCAVHNFRFNSIALQTIVVPFIMQDVIAWQGIWYKFWSFQLLCVSYEVSSLDGGCNVQVRLLPQVIDELIQFVG